MFDIARKGVNFKDEADIYVLFTFGLVNLWNGNKTVGFWLYDKLDWWEWLMTTAMGVSRGGGYDLPLPSGERAPTWRRLYCVYNAPGYTKWSLISHFSGVACYKCALKCEPRRLNYCSHRLPLAILSLEPLNKFFWNRQKVISLW